MDFKSPYSYEVIGKPDIKIFSALIFVNLQAPVNMAQILNPLHSILSHQGGSDILTPKNLMKKFVF